jgi:hypothetical protein
MELQENALDPVNKELCKDFFIGNSDVLKEKVKDYIIDSFLKWFIKLGFEKKDIKSIILIGSSLGYQYTDTSDLDVNVTINITDEKIKELIKILPNGNNLLNTKHQINYHISNKERFKNDFDAGYDLMNDKWLKKPSKEKSTIPSSYVLEITKFFMSGIQDRIAEYERDKIELEMFKTYSPEKMEVSKEEIDKLVSSKETEIRADLDALYIAYHIIRAFRQEAYGEEGENFEIMIDINIKSPNYSINNLIYKTLEKFGYLEKLLEAKKEREKLLDKNK